MKKMKTKRSRMRIRKLFMKMKKMNSIRVVDTIFPRVKLFV